MPKIEDFLAENEEIVDRIKATKHEIVVTDRRLVVHDMEWGGNYLVDAMLSRITSIQAFRKAKLSYLVGSGISFVFWIIFLMIAESLPRYSDLKDFFSAISWFLFFVAIGLLIIVYFLTIRSEISVNVDSADPISIEYRGKASAEVIQRLSKAIRHRKQDVSIKSS
jgi:hypothetical protein